MATPVLPVFDPAGRFRVETRTKDGVLATVLPVMNMNAYFFINKPDQLDVDVPLYHSSVTRSNIEEAVHELWMYRDGKLVYAGPLWDVMASSGEKKLTLKSEGLLSYFDLRILDVNKTYRDKYAFDIARDLITWTQTLVDGDLDIELGIVPYAPPFTKGGFPYPTFAPIPTYATIKSRKYKRHELTTIAKLIEDLSKESGGWDYQIDANRNFNVYAPQKGQTLPVTTLSFRNQISRYSMQYYGKTVGNYVRGRGGSKGADGEEMLTNAFQDYISSTKFKLMQRALSFSDAKNITQLESVVIAELIKRRVPSNYPTLVTREGSINMFDGSFNLGDVFKCIIDDGYVQFNRNMRVVGFNLIAGRQDQETIVFYVDDTIPDLVEFSRDQSERIDAVERDVHTLGVDMYSWSRSGTLSVAKGQHRIYNDTGKTFGIKEVRASVGIAPTGASVKIDVNKDETTLFTTQSNRPEISIGSNTDTSTPDIKTWEEDSYLTVDVDQVGSDVAGANLTVSVVIR